MARPKFDLVKTIDDEDEVSDYSVASDEEETFQPKRQKVEKKDFESDFAFFSTAEEYNENAWDDWQKYLTRKPTNTVAERIALARWKTKTIKNGDNAPDGENVEDEPSDVETDSEAALSDSDLQNDEVKAKPTSVKRLERMQRTGKLKAGTAVTVEADQAEDDFFEDAPPVDENISFTQMNISRPLLKAIATLNYIYPTPVQAAAIPVALQGRDICGCAATGTGKTAAYMLPVLERLLFKPDQTATTRVLVLVPTRELGVQVYQVTKQLSQFTTIETGLSVGGLDVKAQEAELRRCPDIVISTPGRLIDHIKNTPSFDLHAIEVLILDEADRMLDENFAEQMKEIIKSTSRTRQTMLFSATMTTEIENLAAVSLNKPVKIFVDSNSQVAFNLRQEFIRMKAGRENDREALLAALVCRTFKDHTIVFVKTKVQAHKTRLLLGLLGIKVGELHGNLSQVNRLENLRLFKDGELDVIVATDVAARGLDIRGVKTVINFIMPRRVDHYIHRVGRTARAGRAGISISLVTEGDHNMVKEIVKKTSTTVKNRIIPPEIIEKYRKKCAEQQHAMQMILEDEKCQQEYFEAERTIKRLESELKEKGKKSDKKKGREEPTHSQGFIDRDRTLEELKAAKEKYQQLKERKWFQTPKERQEEKDRLKPTNPWLEKEGDEKKKKKKKRGKVVTEEMKKAGWVNIDEYRDNRRKKAEERDILRQSRIAKRLKKPRKMGLLPDKEQGSRKRKSSALIGKQTDASQKASSFSRDLTDTSSKGVKRIRQEANTQKRLDGIQKKKMSGVHGNTKKFNKNRPGQKKKR